MRVKLGDTLVSRLTIDVQYRCSSCYVNNRIEQTVTGQAEMDRKSGISTTRDLVAHARADLAANLAAISDPKNPDRYRKAAFTCRCKNCGYMEPWARMNYERLKKPAELSLYIFIGCSVVLLFPISVFLFDSHVSLSDTALQLVVLIVAMFIMSLGVYIGIRVYKKKNSEKMEKLIAKLPERSLPHILPHETQALGKRERR